VLRVWAKEAFVGSWRYSHMDMIVVLVVPAIVLAVVIFGANFVLMRMKRRKRHRPQRRGFEVLPPPKK
jgi:hypothetical protein